MARKIFSIVCFVVANIALIRGAWLLMGTWAILVAAGLSALWVLLACGIVALKDNEREQKALLSDMARLLKGR